MHRTYEEYKCNDDALRVIHRSDQYVRCDESVGSYQLRYGMEDVMMCRRPNWVLLSGDELRLTVKFDCMDKHMTHGEVRCLVGCVKSDAWQRLCNLRCGDWSSWLSEQNIMDVNTPDDIATLYPSKTVISKSMYMYPHFSQVTLRLDESRLTMRLVQDSVTIAAMVTEVNPDGVWYPFVGMIGREDHEVIMKVKKKAYVIKR